MASEPKIIVTKQLAVTFTDTSDVMYGGGSAIRNTVIIDLTEEQQRLLAIKVWNDQQLKNITSITPIQDTVTPSTNE